MSGHERFPDTDLSGFIDGELPADRAAVIAAAIKTDMALAARVAGLAADKSALGDAFRPVMDEKLPASWIARIEHAAPPRPRLGVPQRAAWAMAIAACAVLAVGIVSIHPWRPNTEDAILEQANSARNELTAPLIRLAGTGLQDAGPRDAVLSHAVGLKLRAPDLIRLGWVLQEMDTYPGAAALRYRAGDGHSLTLFVRRSSGTPRFELLKDGTIRTCIWQDEVVGAVMIGQMTAGQMMRVAGTAYVALNL